MPLLGIYPKKTASLTQKDGCTPTSTAVSPTTAEIRSSPDSDRLRKRDTSEGDVEQNPAAWNKIVCIDLEGIVRSAMNQLNTLLFCVESQQTNNSTGRLETTDAMAREPPVQLEPQNPGSHPELHHVRPAHRPDPRRLPVRHLLHQENDRLLAAAQLPAHPAHAPGSHGGGGLPHGLPRPPGTGSGDHADCPARDLGQVGASPGARPADLHEHIRERTGTLHRPAADRVHLSVAGLAHGLLHFRRLRLRPEPRLVRSVPRQPRGSPVHQRRRAGLHHSLPRRPGQLQRSHAAHQGHAAVPSGLGDFPHLLRLLLDDAHHNLLLADVHQLQPPHRSAGEWDAVCPPLLVCLDPQLPVRAHGGLLPGQEHSQHAHGAEALHHAGAPPARRLQRVPGLRGLQHPERRGLPGPHQCDDKLLHRWNANKSAGYRSQILRLP
ncbi:uncharacterized protein LOC120606101 isoform X5 [Pteropus medius]|uniref:uncharacterized protein LOC120606101 isoform X5 n=1 Tax=Pteropus vampyrus TaxID=132908 RepID=UPI00196B3668|nr:uncharacterized protein LOC120606101 isoform X5 [Pteropus giganteus]